jgi:hypothetical protein
MSYTLTTVAYTGVWSCMVTALFAYSVSSVTG